MDDPSVRYAKPPQGFADPDLRTIIDALAQQGWTARDFERNQLLYAYQAATGNPGKGSDLYRRYWLTVARLQRILSRTGIAPVIIKSRRSYPYYDSNVDVLISRSDWPRAVSALSADRWRVPSRVVRLKQSLIERSKLKLPSLDGGLVPAHLYGAVSWRYQSDVGFLPRGKDSKTYIEKVRLDELCPSLPELKPIEVLMPVLAADFLIHCAQTVYENYRLFLGEAYYLSWLWRQLKPSEEAEMQQIAVGHGASGVLPFLKACIERLVGQPERPQSQFWPCNLPTLSLFRIWKERFHYRRRQHKPIRGIEEMLGYVAFASLYRVKRRLWG